MLVLGRVKFVEMRGLNDMNSENGWQLKTPKFLDAGDAHRDSIRASPLQGSQINALYKFQLRTHF